jgi:hypothetical protein
VVESISSGQTHAAVRFPHSALRRAELWGILTAATGSLRGSQALGPRLTLYSINREFTYHWNSPFIKVISPAVNRTELFYQPHLVIIKYLQLYNIVILRHLPTA